jgi:hypothetical protein
MKYEGGIDDIGNEIGIVVAKYFNGFDDSFAFISGIKHGISLTDGTHDLNTTSKKKINKINKYIDKLKKKHTT